MQRRATRLISLRISEPLRKQLQTVARKREISTTQLMRELLKSSLEADRLSFAKPHSSNHRRD